MIDLHTHLWPHEPGTDLPTYDDLARSCEYAIQRGVQQIAITEHCNRFEEIVEVALPLWRRDSTTPLKAAADRVWEVERGAHLDDYVTLLTTAQARGLPLLVGLEVDHLPGANEAISEVLQEYPFDVLLGSVHWIGAWLFDAYGDPVFAAEWDHRPIEEVWNAYVDAVIELAQELYPSPRLLGLLHEVGVGLTTASDAHQLDHLGHRFGEVYASLRALGIETLTTFTRRQRQRVSLA